MDENTEFDRKAAHKYFSVNCFNQAWDLIDKTKRTPEEDEEMIRLSLTSHYHWTQRDDYSNTSTSIAHWQISRIYAILGRADNARRYGQLCLGASQEAGVAPFFLGYAYEALARAEAAGGKEKEMQALLNDARTTAEKIKEADEKNMLLDDLKTIQIK